MLKPPRSWPFTIAAAASLMLLTGACSSESPRSSEQLGKTQAGATMATPGFVETTVLSGLDAPTVVRFASDGRVFVAEKGGKILVFDDLSDTTPTTFVGWRPRSTNTGIAACSE